MEKYCECEIYYKSFNDVLNRIMKKYGLLSKIKSKDVTNQKKYDILESLYLSLKQMIESLPNIGNKCISFMKKCSKEHKEQLEEITSKLSQIDVLSQRTEDYHKKLMNEIPQELPEFSDEEEEKEEQKKTNKINKDEEEIDEKNIIIIENLYENEELKRKRNEEKREIIKLKNSINDLWNNILEELKEQDDKIDDIDTNVDKGLNNVNKGNIEELEKEAISAVNRRRITYPGGLALAFGAAGSFVPGIGSVIGAAIGGMIGYGLYRVDKHRLDNALKK